MFYTFIEIKLVKLLRDFISSAKNIFGKYVFQFAIVFSDINLLWILFLDN